MITLIHEHPTAKASLRCDIALDTPTDEAIEIFVNFLMACGASNAAHMSIQEAEEFWAAEDDLPESVEVTAAIEYSVMLRDIIINSWPLIVPHTLRVWSKGYVANNDIAEELVFLADILSEFQE